MPRFNALISRLESDTRHVLVHVVSNLLVTEQSDILLHTETHVLTTAGYISHAGCTSTEIVGPPWPLFSVFILRALWLQSWFRRVVLMPHTCR